MAEPEVITITANHSQLAKLGELLNYAFQENNYFEMEGEKRKTFNIEIDDNPAIYDATEDGNAEAICYLALLDLEGEETE